MEENIMNPGGGNPVHNCVGSLACHIDANLTGVTVLAIGSSLPDFLSSLIVARKGRGDMAIANALGSNIFDVLICLGVPFALKSMSEDFRAVSVGTRNSRAEFIALTVVAFVQIFLYALLLVFSSLHGRRVLSFVDNSMPQYSWAA